MIEGTAAIRSTRETRVDSDPRRRVLADVERGDQRQREGDRHRDQGDQDGPAEHGGDAEDVGLRLPRRLGEEAPPVVPQGRQRLPAEEDPDATGDDEDDRSDHADREHEDLVRTGGLARDLARGVASAADASWSGRVVTWFFLARRSVERAGKRQKCQEITGTNGPAAVNDGRTATPAFANFAARAFSDSPNGSDRTTLTGPFGPGGVWGSIRSRGTRRPSHR